MALNAGTPATMATPRRAVASWACRCLTVICTTYPSSHHVKHTTPQTFCQEGPTYLFEHRSPSGGREGEKPRRAGVPLVAANRGGAQVRACNDKRGTKAAHASRHQRRRATAGSALQSARPGASHAARPRALHGRCCPYRAAGEPCEPFKGRSGASCAAPRGLLPSPAAGELCEPRGAPGSAPELRAAASSGASSRRRPGGS